MHRDNLPGPTPSIDHGALLARTRALIGESRRLLDEAARAAQGGPPSEHLAHRAWWVALLARSTGSGPPSTVR